ncbi:CaiB/BaiF CoA-transferase family protein [Pseudomonadales bacterium]|nr:CaiB/BaiF CoA-transferase family protein [Pseudomonadales bacterium]
MPLIKTIVNQTRDSVSAVKPLSGLNVIDFSMAYAGPICGRMLSDCGADVIKVEPLGVGDGVRGDARIFTHFNAGKRGVQIDLSTSEGQQLALGLIDQADVVIENYRPGIMKRFGLDYASVKTQCPSLVYCSISGFGQTGPAAQRAAYAPIAHAASGYDTAHMNAQVHTDDSTKARPPASGIMIADMLTGAYAFGAIQTALLGRFNTGLGDYIDVTMMESMMTLIPAQQQAAQIADSPPRGGFLPIKAKDGYIMACIVTDKNFEGLCQVIHREDLHQDDRFERFNRIKNLHHLVVEIEKWSVTRTIADCEAQLNSTGVPCSRYNAVEDLFNDPQLQHRGTFSIAEDEEGEYFVQNLPFQLASQGEATTPVAPEAGKHTDSVLKDSLGLDIEAISTLRKNQIVS